MNNTYKTFTLTIVLLLFFLSIPRPAYAYIGPGSLTLVLQIVAGFMIGGVAVLAMQWSKIKSKLSKQKKKK